MIDELCSTFPAVLGVYICSWHTVYSSAYIHNADNYIMYVHPQSLRTELCSGLPPYSEQFIMKLKCDEEEDIRIASQQSVSQRVLKLIESNSRRICVKPSILFRFRIVNLTLQLSLSLSFVIGRYLC